MINPRPIQAAELVAQAYKIVRVIDAGLLDDVQHEQLLNRLFESIIDLEPLAGRQLGPIAREVLGPGFEP